MAALADAPIVVVGGGPAGSATACFLAERGARVLVLDGAHFPRRKACAEYLSPGGAAIVRTLGIDLDQHGRQLLGMRVRASSGACHALEYRDPSGQALEGVSISRLVLDTRLVEAARARGVEVREGCRVTSVVLDQGHGHGRVTGVRLHDGSELRAAFVVGADGRHSVVARAGGPAGKVFWPRRLGRVAHYRGVAWPEAYGQLSVSRSGYVGVAPLDDAGLLSVGLVTPLRRRPLDFDTALQAYPGLVERLARGQRDGPIMGIGPLARRVRACGGPGYLLVGDAAGFFDPFTGEGIFRALRGAQLAAASIVDGLDYAAARARAFAAKERLTRLIQLFVHAPPLLELAIRRLEARPRVAAHLGNVLGDLEPARLNLVWQLLGP